MSLYRLTPAALADLRDITTYLAEEAGEEIASRTEDQLFAAFEHLAAFPGLGHYRSDLTPRQLVFFAVDPYLVVYGRQITPITIYAVLHAARDVRRVLRKRL